jgi:hypothetical protein
MVFQQTYRTEHAMRTASANHGQVRSGSQYVIEDGNGLSAAVELAEQIAKNTAISNFAAVQALPRIAQADAEAGYLMEPNAAISTGSVMQWSAKPSQIDDSFGTCDLKDAVEFRCHGAFSSDPAGARPAPLEGEARRIAGEATCRR